MGNPFGTRCCIVLLVVFAAVSAAGAAEVPGESARALKLSECVQIALQQSPRVTIARENLAGSRAGLRRSYSSYLPQASITTQHGRTAGVSFLDTPGGVIPLATSAIRHEADLILSQTFWQTGRRRALEQARASYHASQENEEATRQQVIQAVAGAYYQALAARNLVEVAEANLKAFQETLAMVKARVEVGEAPRVDVAPAEADVANAELQLIQAQNSAEVALARLKNEMGVSPTTPVLLADTFGPGQAELPSLSEALATANDKRPEVRSSKAALQADLQALVLAQERQGPIITVGGQYDEGLSGDLRRTSWNFTASAQVFVFDGGARKSDVHAAKASFGVAEGQHQQLLNDVGLEVETARLDVATAGKSIEAAAKSLARAEAQLGAAEGKYREGVGIYLEITNAQSALTQARINRIQAILDYHQALVNFRKALGTLSLETLPLDRGAP